PPPRAALAPDGGGAPPAIVAADPGTPSTIREQAEAVGDLDISDGIDLPPPPLTDEPPAERPDRPVADPAYVLGQREAGVRLLDTTIERLASEAEELQRSGDREGAQRLRIRHQRAVALRARRAAELETMRAGGELPSTDPEDRVREGTLVPEEEPR
ncbi:MAG: hypothetical protein M3Y87_32290, partial [Myxococcota bacterium]|nr:hypothetical protein [Myxococcota bacterium]